jgi:predicted 3-demethylubiquinone-9 3-methyltransferase (glyoxalase superfamily)
MQRITPFLWFDTQAEEAAKHYVSIFKNSQIHTVQRYGEAGPGPKGSVMTVAFSLDGVDFVALNAGPQFKFTEAISFVINCKDQKEVDYYWDRLCTGGSEGRCGWLKDKFGMSWQVVPEGIGEVLESPKAMQAMLEMTKLDLSRLQQAARG